MESRENTSWEMNRLQQANVFLFSPLRASAYEEDEDDEYEYDDEYSDEEEDDDVYDYDEYDEYRDEYDEYAGDFDDEDEDYSEDLDELGRCNFNDDEY